MNKKGFTIVELLVTLFIIGIVLSAAYMTYIYLLKSFKKESAAIETQIESIVGLELLRLDLEHLGYGIASDETAKIIEWDNSSNKLTLRETINNTNQSTIGYTIAKCETNTLKIKLDRREDKTNNYLSILNADDRTFFSKGEISGSNITGTSSTCTNNKLYIGSPIRKEVYDGSANGCSKGLCEQIEYYLSGTSDLLDRCNVNTKNLIRKVGKSTAGGEPVLNCVADFKVRFDVDENEDGSISSSEENKNSPPANNSLIRKRLKRVNIYLLIQESKYDPDYNFQNEFCNTATKKCEIDGVELKLPNDFLHYRWKILKISVKSMDL